MRQPSSIRFHLTIVFLFFFLLVIVLGLFSISRLSSFNRVSEDIADLWLPKTRVLGDLNNFTSDFRAVEGSNLLASDNSDITATEKELEELDRSIAQSERSYEQIRHDAVENTLYEKFKETWNAYRKVVNQILILSRTGHKSEAIAMYLSSSHAAYTAASDALEQLTERTVAQAHEASGRIAAAYRQAFWLVGGAMGLAGVMVAAVLLYPALDFGAAPASCRLHAPPCRQRYRHRDPGYKAARRDRRDGARRGRISQQCHRADAQPAPVDPADCGAGGETRPGATARFVATQFRVDGVA